MALEADSLEFVSFSDDTSLPFAVYKVSIQGEVGADSPLDWFYRLRPLVSAADEIKSKQIIELFFALDQIQRRKLFQTLKTVRVHITDPRPYFGKVSGLEKYLPPGTSLPEFLKRLHREEHVARVQLMLRKGIMDQMLHDAPSKWVKLSYLAWECARGVRLARSLGIAADVVETPDLTPFGCSESNPINQVPPFLSQSAPVFHRVADAIVNSIDSDYWSGAFSAHRALCDAHAFDTGKSGIVPWIEGQRSDVATLTNRHGLFAVARRPLQELDSRNSPRIQAADWAVAIARELWYRSSLVQVVSAFEYVTYNGRRISESDATEHQNRLNASGN